jgi:methyl-accepting chemotaxis protein
VAAQRFLGPIPLSNSSSGRLVRSNVVQVADQVVDRVDQVLDRVDQVLDRVDQVLDRVDQVLDRVDQVGQIEAVQQDLGTGI